MVKQTKHKPQQAIAKPATLADRIEGFIKAMDEYANTRIIAEQYHMKDLKGEGAHTDEAKAKLARLVYTWATEAVQLGGEIAATARELADMLKRAGIAMPGLHALADWTEGKPRGAQMADVWDPLRVPLHDAADALRARGDAAAGDKPKGWLTTGQAMARLKNLPRYRRATDGALGGVLRTFAKANPKGKSGYRRGCLYDGIALMKWARTRR